MIISIAPSIVHPTLRIFINAPRATALKTDRNYGSKHLNTLQKQHQSIPINNKFILSQQSRQTNILYQKYTGPIMHDF